MHGDRRHVLRHAGAQRDDARDVRRLRRLADAAEDHLVDQRGIDAGAREQRIDGDAAEVVRGKRRERGADFAERRPDSVNDDQALGHGKG